MDTASLTALVTLMTVISGFLVQIYRENRNRRWDMEDRKILAAKVEDAKVLVSETSKELKTMIHENTKISTDAFHEANTVNLKLEKLGIAHNTQSAEQTAAVEKLTEAVKRETNSPIATDISG